MQRTVVEGSSNVVSYGYDVAEMVLEVEFKNGTYRYRGVPWSIATDLAASESKGSFVRKNVVGKFEFEKLQAAAD